MGFGFKVTFFAREVDDKPLENWATKSIGLPNQLGYHNFSSQLLVILDGIGMNWAMITYDYHIRGHLGQPGFQIQAAATYLQSWGERARAVAVVWLHGAEMLHFTVRNARNTRTILGLQCLPSTNIYGPFM